MNMPRTIHIPNGENIVHTFSDEEYQNRQRKLRAHMAWPEQEWRRYWDPWQRSPRPACRPGPARQPSEDPDPR